MLTNSETAHRNGTAIASPRADVYEADDAYVVSLDMPGVLRDAIHVTVENSTLAVHAVGPSPVADDSTSRLDEIKRTEFRRSFNLGKDVDVERIEAQYHQGVLTIRIHKNESAKPRTIQIQ